MVSTTESRFNRLKTPVIGDMRKKAVKSKKALQYEAARSALYDSYGGVKPRKSKPLVVDYYSDGSGDKYKSLTSSKPVVCGVTSIMDPHNLSKETPEIQSQIIKKASRVGPLFNKGGYQFGSDYELGIEND